MNRMPSLVATVALVLLAASLLPAQSPEKTLKDLGLGTDGKALLDYFRKQTYPEADPKQMDVLIRELGADDFKTRETAYAKLIGIGKGAIVGLKQAEKDNDPEIRLRAGDLVKKLEAKVEPSVQVASARLIAQLKPEGAAEVLLAFLPFAADLSVTDEVCNTLSAVAITDKGVDPAVVKALDEKLPIKRAAAGEALARAKVTELMPAVRKLLKDPDPIVRVRTGAALVNARDNSAITDAVPALIEGLKHLPPENLWAAEDILIRLAGEGKVPAASLGTNEKTKEQCFKAWETWYVKNQKDITLAKLDLADPILGNTLIVYQPVNRVVVAVPGVAVRRPIAGEIVEVDMNKKVLWKMTIDESLAVDAMVLPDSPGEVVVAEYNRTRVTIRETKTNKIVWEQAVGGPPIGVQALAGGKIIVTTQNRIVEYDRIAKKEKTLVNVIPGRGAIFRSKMTKNGDLVYITNLGMLTRLNAKGVEVKKFQVPEIPVQFGNIDLLANGNLVFPDFAQQRVVEFDTNGNQVAQVTVPLNLSAAMRLPNGNTLVSSQNAARVMEINRDGHTVWSHDVEGQVYNTRRR